MSLFYFTSYVLNMFRTLIYPSSGACNCAVSVLKASACHTDTSQIQPHQISNTQWAENKTTDMVIQQHSCKLLMMDILMSETRWVPKKWNKIASDINLVFYSSIVVMNHCVSYNMGIYWLSEEPLSSQTLCPAALVSLKLLSCAFVSVWCDRMCS